MHKNRVMSQVVEDSEPTRNQSFTELLAELRLAQVWVFWGVVFVFFGGVWIWV